MIRYSHHARADVDWLLFGYPLDKGGVMVAATQHLHGVTLDVEDEDITMQTYIEALSHVISPNLIYTLNTRFTKIVLARGDTYADAILNLFRGWSPDEPDHPQIQAQRGLPAQTDR